MRGVSSSPNSPRCERRLRRLDSSSDRIRRLAPTRVGESHNQGKERRHVRRSFRIGTSQ
jgi:hypothetical protein